MGPTDLVAPSPPAAAAASRGFAAPPSSVPLGSAIAGDALLLLSSQASNARVVTALLRVRDGVPGGVVRHGLDDVKWLDWFAVWVGS